MARFPTLILLLLASAANAAITPNNCSRAAKYSESKRGLSLLVIQNGQTIFERYARGASPNGRWPIFSGTKSFWGLAALCAVNDGLFKLDDPVAATITEWKTDPRKSRITIRQLLNLTSGLEGASRLHRSSFANRNAAAIRVQCVAEPGTRFIYGPSHLQVFVEVLRRKLGGRSSISYIQEKVLGPLNLGAMEFKADRRGNPLAATGFELTAREWARLGQLILSHGSYNGRRIVSANLLNEALSGSAPNSGYGLTFWLNSQAPRGVELDIEKELDLPWERARWNNVCIARAAPADMVIGLGSGYQRLFVIPSLNVVIVRQGKDAKFSDSHFLRLLLGRG
ncbi:MAG TPA: serine hydrolase [Chthoniobacterales bacterium]|nr:serine hydrolase [Chthoniobacterales bacterium]